MKNSLDRLKLNQLSSFCEENPTNILALTKCKNFLLEFIDTYNQNLPKVKTRGKKRRCVICSTLFYDLGRNSEICMRHIITPEDKSLLSLISKIDDYIERNTSDKIFVNDEWNVNDNLRSLFRYHPDIDNCWKFKACNQEIINNIFTKVDELICNDIIICTIPSHDPQKLNTGINLLTNLLAEKGRVDGSRILIRTKKIDKKGTGGVRDKSVDLDSIVANNLTMFQNKVVLLLDDVATSGNSMKACTEILLKNGAKRVSKLAIWKAGSHT